MRIGVIFGCYGGNIVVIWPLQAKMGAKIAPISVMGALVLLLGKPGIQAIYKVGIVLFGKHLLCCSHLALRHFRRT